MALSQSTLVTRIRRLLGDEPFEDYITADPSTGTTVAVNQPQAWGEGDVMEFSDGDLAKVRQTGVSGASITVKRSHDGTTAAAHTASGATAVIYKNPEFRFSVVTEAIDHVIRGLWPYAWKKSTASITPNTTSTWFDLASSTDYRGLIDASQRYGSSNEHLGWFGRGDGRSIVIRPNMPTALVTSGTGVRFPGGFYHASNVVLVNYRSALTATVSGGNYSDLSDGLAGDVVVYGACSHLLSGKEVERLRTDVTQGDASHRPGDDRRGAAWFEAQFRDYRRQFETELRGSIPPARVWSG